MWSTDAELRDRFERWWKTPSIEAVERHKLYKLAWDIVGSEFAGRHMLYEKFYAGSSIVVRNQSDREAPWQSFHDTVDRLLASIEVPGRREDGLSCSKQQGGASMKRLFAVLTGMALSVAAGTAAQAQADFPNRPIRIIVPQAAGSGIDLHARTLAQKMGELWGHQGVVENRPGANAIIGMEVAARAAPDGYTLVYAPVSSVTTNQFIYKKLPYDPLRDFAPITQTVANPLGLVSNPASGIKIDQGRGRRAPRPIPASSTTARSASAT